MRNPNTWIQIWIWIQYCPWVGSGFKSVKFYGFGFRIVHGLGWVSNMWNLMDLDSVLDSILSVSWVGLEICEILWIWISFGFKIVHGLGWVSNLWNLMDLDSVLDSILSMGWVGLWICFFCLDLGSVLHSFFFSNTNQWIRIRQPLLNWPKRILTGKFVH